MRGSIVRRNILKNHAHIELKGIPYKSPGLRDAVIEFNLKQRWEFRQTRAA